MSFWHILIGFLLIVHFLVGVFLIIIVLMQRSKEGGIGTAFGGGLTDSLFGASSGNVLSKITVWMACIFFATSLSMAIMFSHPPQKQINIPIPPAPVAPAPESTLTPEGGTLSAPEGTITPSTEPAAPPSDAPDAATPEQQPVVPPPPMETPKLNP